MANLVLLAVATWTVAAAPPLTDSWEGWAQPPPPTAASAAIALCESGNDVTAKNPTSSASGAWQFVDSTWQWVTGLQPPARAYPRAIQRAAFDKLWDGGRGASHWAPSRSCWGSKININGSE